LFYELEDAFANSLGKRSVEQKEWSEFYEKTNFKI
jgi:hypothetical protein